MDWNLRRLSSFQCILIGYLATGVHAMRCCFAFVRQLSVWLIRTLGLFDAIQFGVTSN